MNGFETILPFLKPIEHLILDDSISEVMVNGPDRIFIEKAGFIEVVRGVSLGEKNVDQGSAANLVGERESRRLIDPHQRRMDDEAPIGTERQSELHRFDRIVAAIRIAGEIGFTHTGYEMMDVAPVRDRAGESEEHQITSGHEGCRQARFVDLDLGLTGERCV